VGVGRVGEGGGEVEEGGGAWWVGGELGLNAAAYGGLIEIALGFICVSNETNQVHTKSHYIYFNFSTCFGQLCTHH